MKKYIIALFVLFSAALIAQTITLNPGVYTLTSSSGSGTVTSVSVVTAGGISGNVATNTTTPAITLAVATQGINDSSVNAATTAFVNTAAVSLTGTGSVNIDCSLSRNFYTTVTGNVTYTFTNTYDGMTIVVDVLGDASHTVAFTSAKWPANTTPTQTLSQHDVYTFKKINSRINASALQNMTP
jgi:hypothetical protein